MFRTRQSLFVAASVAALGFAACGRQVTPTPAGLGPGGTPPGYMAVFFNVAAPFDFTDYQYMVVLNTSGSGATPSTDTWQTNWSGYDFAIVAQGNAISSSASAIKYYRSSSNPRVPPGTQNVGTTPQLFSYNLNPNGTGTEFSILAQRRIFNSSPAPGATPSNVWTFNAFTTMANAQGEWRFEDSMGAGGPIDPQYVSPELCMTEPFDNVYYPQGQYTPPFPASQITSIEIANNPVSPGACP
jgi:hypothetical protein